MIDWLFRSRATGKITIIQLPNLPLAAFLVASGLRRLVGHTGTLHEVLTTVATVGLVVWAVDEVFRGVNPFRRGLGGVVLIAQLIALTR